MSTPKSIKIKICGITSIQDARAIADLDVDAIGVIGVETSKRFVNEHQRREIFSCLNNYAPNLQRVWVIANMNTKEISEGLQGEGVPSIVQLHGEETLQECSHLRQEHPHIKWWKAIRVRTSKDVLLANNFSSQVDALLIDAWSPNELGGTGQRIPLELISHASINSPWWLAGGISSEWIPQILSQTNPSGIDASSKLEKCPGIKDLNKVEDLIQSIRKEEIKDQSKIFN